MIRMFGFFFMTILVGGPVVGETVTVRSGEHEGFTRLALKLPVTATWTVATSNRSVILKTDVPSISFDVSEVFDRISRDRVVSLSQEIPGADLVLSLGCDCSVLSFEEPSGLIAIDIKEDTTQPIRPYLPLPTRLPSNQTPYRFVGGEEPLAAVSDLPQALLMPVIHMLPTRLEPEAEPRQTVARRPGTVNVSEKRLLAQINRASEQGLVELSMSPEASELLKVEDGTSAPVKDAEVMKPQTTPLPVSVSVSTAADRDLAALDQMVERSSGAKSCLTSEQVSLHEWAGSRPFPEEIAHWRARLFGEFDRLDANAALSLSRAYLHFGFGAEAAQMIDLSAQSSEDTRILKAISQLIDGGILTSPHPFLGQQNCSSDVALWAVLSDTEISGNLNKNALKQAFSRLPLHLRSHLGPQLSRRFANAGDRQMAGAILRTVTRTDVEPGSGVELASAVVAELHGDVSTVEQELTKSLTTDTQHAPKALILLVAKKFETRAPVSPELTDLAAAYALEFRNTPLGADLNRTHAISLAMTGHFSDAFEVAASSIPQEGTADPNALASLLTLLAERADDVTFLQTTLRIASDNVRDIPEATMTKIAKRLLDLGFPRQAVWWVPVSKSGHSSESLRLLRAEIAVASKLPHRAEVELLGLNGPRADRLRAAAMMQNGDYLLAGELLESSGAIDNAAREFWLADEWENTPEKAESRYARITATSRELREENSILSPPTPLAEARALIQNSFAVRSQISALLEAVSSEQ